MMISQWADLDMRDRTRIIEAKVRLAAMGVAKASDIPMGDLVRRVMDDWLVRTRVDSQPRLAEVGAGGGGMSERLRIGTSGRR